MSIKSSEDAIDKLRNFSCFMTEQRILQWQEVWAGRQRKIMIIERLEFFSDCDI